MSIRIRGTRFVYYPVPKVGCTSLKLAIMQHNEPLRFARLAANEAVHGARGGYRSPPWLLDWRHRLRVRGTRPFCVVRDPIERFTSAYRDLIARRQLLGTDECGVPDINLIALTLRQYRANRHLWHHVAPMVDFLGDDPSYFDRIFLLGDIGSVGDYVGVPLQIPHANRGDGPRDVSGLSAEATARLHEFYAADYRAWGEFLYRAPSHRWNT